MATSPGQTPASSVGQAMVEALASKGEPPSAARPRLDPEGGRGQSISYRDPTGEAAVRNADRRAGRR